MKPFDFLCPKRSEKPRKTGLTMVLDKGMGFTYAKDLLELSGEYIDFMKFGWGTITLHDRKIIERKINLYKDYDIIPYPGGTLFEIAYIQNKTDEYFKEAKEIGFETVEISNGTADIPLEEKYKYIDKATDLGFKVISEVGKKNPDKDSEIEIKSRCELVKKELEMGSHKVILEARESGKSVGIFDSKGEIKENEFKILYDNLNTDNIIWEAPQKNQQIFLILNVGANVNLGNISPEEITSLETLRRGLRGDTIGKV